MKNDAKKIKIMIASPSERIRSFFSLEALELGFVAHTCEKIEKANNDLSDYELLIIDVALIKQRPLNSAKKTLTVSLDGSGDIAYPMALCDLRRFYLDLLRGEGAREEICDFSEVTVTFFENEKNIIALNEKKYLLSDTEIKLLRRLCENAGEIVSKEAIDTLLCVEGTNLSNVYVHKLRKKLETPSGRKFLFTVHSKGYKTTAKAEWK